MSEQVWFKVTFRYGKREVKRIFKTFPTIQKMIDSMLTAEEDIPVGQLPPNTGDWQVTNIEPVPALEV